MDLSLSSDDAEAWDVESSFTLSGFVGLRAELAAGDLWLLYLASLPVWKLAEDEEEEYVREVEPPVPTGLGGLTRLQKALTDFLKVDESLLAIAAETFATLKGTAPADQTKVPRSLRRHSADGREERIPDRKRARRSREAWRKGQCIVPSSVSAVTSGAIRGVSAQVPPRTQRRRPQFIWGLLHFHRPAPPTSPCAASLRAWMFISS
ncbi:hypothetical protein [Streptomyces rimosus]|uniref:hypothetical protein n=1 Tax=Streptomyces rimosus TaxID=1927 RepID=UPI0037A3526A